jgi:sugar phosphate permease
VAGASDTRPTEPGAPAGALVFDDARSPTVPDLKTVPTKATINLSSAVPGAAPSPLQSQAWLGTLVAGYIGVYLCRKNLAVAIPAIQETFDVSRAEIGLIVSASTISYAAGKFIFGPLIDRFGGRVSFLLSLLFVGLFAFAGSLATTLPLLTLAYSANRFAGSAAWGAMVKMVPGWFTRRQLPFAIAWLSLSFVFGGVFATLLAGQIAEWSGNDWRWIMGGPALVLAVILIICAAILPRRQPAAPDVVDAGSGTGFAFGQIPQLLRLRQFWIVCALSFTLTLLRETFNTWTVDFFKAEGGGDLSSRVAAFLSTPFDACGALGIIALGWVFGRVGPGTRMRLLFGMLVLLSMLVQALPGLMQQGRWVVAIALGLIGFLAYGPYSLLAGILAVEIRGRAYVATVAGIVDGVGYLAGILAGYTFGRIVDVGGYRLGFQTLALLGVMSAVLCLFLYPRSRQVRGTAVSPVLVTGRNGVQA